MRIAWTKLAVADLRHLREYVAIDRPETAQTLVERIDDAVKQLLSYQNMGRRGRAKGTKELVIVGTPYLVPYRVKKDRIEILAVMHGSRRWPEGF